MTPASDPPATVAAVVTLRSEVLGPSAFANPKSSTLTVRRFQVAINDAAFVGHREGVSNLFRDAGRFVESDRSFLEFLLEGLALDHLHHDAGRPVHLLEAVDLRDVRMVQRGEDLCFSLESRKAVGVVGEMLGKQLERDIAL
jgi:hypothetical protein